MNETGHDAPSDNRDEDHHLNQDGQGKDPGRVTWKANVQLGIVLVCLIVAFILSQTIGADEREKSESTQTRTVLVRAVKVTPITQNLQFTRTGETEVNNQIQIVPQVSGRIASVHPDFDDGGVFETDTNLFQIEQSDYINQRDIARAEVEHAQTQLALEEAEAQAAREEWESLNPYEPIPPLVAKTPQLNQAKANLQAARAQLAEAQLDLNRTVYSLPYDGRIVETDIEVGQYVQAGQSYGTLYSRDALQVRVPMEDRLLEYIDKDEATAKISTNYRGEDIILRGEIARIGGQLDENTRFVDVIITPAGENWDKMLPNVFADVEVTGRKMDDLWRLPNSVLQGANTVWIIQDDKTLKSYSPKILSIGKEHTLAIGNGETVTLVDGLLKGGSENMKVRLVENTDNNTVKIEDDSEEVRTDQPVIEPTPIRENEETSGKNGDRQENE